MKAPKIDFVTYGQAYVLKKLGFDYPVRSYYCIRPFYGSNIYGRYEYHPGDVVKEDDICKSIKDDIVPRWAVDQALRWFTVQYNIVANISLTAFKTYQVTIVDESQYPIFCKPIILKEEFGTHIDAEYEAINRILSELIKHNPTVYDDYIDDLFNGEMNCNCKPCHKK